MFTIPDVENLISNKFLIIQKEVGRDIGNYENIKELKTNLRNEKKFTIKIPLIFNLLGGINYTCICRKK